MYRNIIFPMKLIYSKPIIPRVGSSRTYSRVFKGDVLGRSIQIYRMWFLFLRLGLDCEDNKVDIIDYVNKKNIPIRVNKNFYKDWSLDRVKTDRFDDWWKDHKHLFVESKTKVVNEIVDNDNFIYVRIDKRSKKTDVIRDLKDILKPNESFSSQFNVQQQHKYIPTHMKYNVFVWRQMGKTRLEIIELLQKYKSYFTQIPQDESSIRRVLRNSEKLIIETSKGQF